LTHHISNNSINTKSNGFTATCLLFIYSMSAIVLSCESAFAFDLGGFLKDLSGQGGNSNRIFHSIRDGSTSSSCRAQYKRDMSNYGWQNQPEYSEGPCPDSAIQKLKQQEKTAYAERVRFCYEGLKRDFGYLVGDYIGKVSSSLCDDYVAGKDIRPSLKEQLDYYSKLAGENRRRIAQEEKASRDSAYAMALTWAYSEQNRINRTKTERSFLYKGNDASTVFVHSIVIRSMNSGITFGGSRVVDANIITQGYKSQATEKRYRIFCNEGGNSKLENGSLTGGNIFITGEMGRWICGRYGIYHPGP